MLVASLGKLEMGKSSEVLSTVGSGGWELQINDIMAFLQWQEGKSSTDSFN